MARGAVPWLPVGRMVLDRNPVDYHSDIEQAAFGTGVLVDGMDFSDDKMLQGRTFSYSDTQRYRVGANYLQLPVNAPKAPVRTNQHRGQMDMRNPKESGENPHINYEPSMLGGYKDAKQESTIHTNQLTMRLLWVHQSIVLIIMVKQVTRIVVLRSGNEMSWLKIYLKHLQYVTKEFRMR